MAAARSGVRAIVVETAGRADVPPMLGRRAGDPLTEVELLPRLHHVTVDRRGALEEYLRQEVPGPIPAAVLARSRTFELFVEATPGMSDLLTIGKVWELGRRPRKKPRTDPYDLVILDAPASGQLAGLLAAPRTFSQLARVGPVARQAARIEHAITDNADVGAVVVTTPEQMAVTRRSSYSRRFPNGFGIGSERSSSTGRRRRGSAPKMGSPSRRLPTIRPSAALFGSTLACRRGVASSSGWWASFRPYPASHCRFYSKRIGRGHIEHLAEFLIGSAHESPQ